MQNFCNKSEETILNSDLFKSIILAFDRTGNVFDSQKAFSMFYDLANEFPTTKPDVIIEALRKGGLGHYGKTYKLSTQELCIWIRQHLIDERDKVRKVRL